MPKVILKRNWFTPAGRFRKSQNPVEISQEAIDKYALPKDARIIGSEEAEAIVASKQPEEDLRHVHDIDRANADAEAEIHAESDRLVAEAKAAKKKK